MKNSRVRNTRVSSSRQRKQQHLLEVTVRHDKAVAIRNRAILIFTFKFLVFATVVVGAYVGGKEGLRRFLWENPDYYLSDVRVVTDGALTREQILSAGGIVEGRNIFTVDLTKAQTALAELPQAERVEVSRVLPNRVNINITERRPIAWVTAKAEDEPSASEKAFLIDARGVVMRSKTLLPEYLHLPVISGVEVENLAAGQRVQTLEMQAALELVRLNSDSIRFQARNIDLAKGYCLLVTDRNHARITFGLDRIDLQLERLNRLLDHLEPVHREIQTVNLLVERNTPVTFVDPNAVVTELPVEPVAGKGGSGKTPGATAGNAASSAKATPAKATPMPVMKAQLALPATSPRRSPVSTPTPQRGVRNVATPKPVTSRPSTETVRKPFRTDG